MKNIPKIMLIYALLLTTTTISRADQIVWAQPKVPEHHQKLHQNVHFEGNAILDRADVRQLQKALAKKKFYKGKIDGIWGPQVSQAILDYQAVNQQPLTGTVTIETLHDLGVHLIKEPQNKASLQ